MFRCGGILCYAVHPATSEWFFLLAQAAYNADYPHVSWKWAEVGGVAHGQQESSRAAAGRECFEETAGCLCVQDSDVFCSSYLEVVYALEHTKQYVPFHKPVMCRGSHVGFKSIYLMRVPWQPELPLKFDQVTTLLRCIQCVFPARNLSMYLEKTQLRWMSYRTVCRLLRRHKQMFRRGFRESFRVLMKNARSTRQ